MAKNRGICNTRFLLFRWNSDNDFVWVRVGDWRNGKKILVNHKLIHVSFF